MPCGVTPAPVTVAVNVTDSPKTDGVLPETMVVVDVAGLTVWSVEAPPGLWFGSIAPVVL